MNRIAQRRRHPLAAFVVVVLGLIVAGVLYAALAPGQRASAQAGESSLQVEQGRQLYLKGCSSCHGMNAEGTSRGPALVGVGAASVDFQVGTGRMPLRQAGAQAPPGNVLYTQQQIEQLAAYVASLGPGPAIPSAADIDPKLGDVAAGGELFRTNCAMCHNFAAQGGALTGGKYAPNLNNTSTRHIFEAMLTGPGAMPVFSNTTLTPQEKRDIIAWVTHIRGETSPGGAPLGKLGPVTEGLLAWTVGIGLLIAAAVWLGAKSS